MTGLLDHTHLDGVINQAQNLQNAELTSRMTKGCTNRQESAIHMNNKDQFNTYLHWRRGVGDYRGLF